MTGELGGTVGVEVKEARAAQSLAAEVLSAMEQDCGPVSAEPYSSWAKTLAEAVLSLPPADAPTTDEALLADRANADRLRESMYELEERVAALLAERDALRSHVIALGRPDLVGEPWPDSPPRRVSVDLDEDARLDISIPPCCEMDDKTLAALRQIGEKALRKHREATDEEKPQSRDGGDS